MAPLFAILIIIACWDCVKSAIRYTRDDYRASRQRAGGAAVKTAPGAPPASSLRRHAGSWWAREVTHLFPAARAGWHAGWLAHRTAVDQRRARREEARTTHLEHRASVLGGIMAHRLLQARAQAEIDELIARRGEPVRTRKAVQEAADEVGRKRAEKARQQDVPPLPSETVTPEPDPRARRQEPDPSASEPVPTPSPAEGMTPMAADVTYDQLMDQSQRHISEQEQHIASLRASRLGNWLDGLTGLLNDSRSLSRAAEVDEALRAEQKAAQQLMDSLQAFRDGLRSDHGGINEAVQDSPVPKAAEPDFYDG